MRGIGLALLAYGMYLEAGNVRNPLTGAVLLGEDGRPYLAGGVVLLFVGGRK